MVLSEKIHDNKGKLRNFAKSNRRKIYSEESARVAQKKLTEFISEQIPNTKYIASYCPIQSEIDPTGAARKLATLGYPLCLPVVCSKNQPLKFRAWKLNEKLVKGEYGVSIPESGDWVIPGLIIVPLLAYDEEGYRLGYGGGYYDRTLEQLKKENKVLAVGFAFSGQFFQDIPKNDYDHKLDALVSEKGITVFDK